MAFTLKTMAMNSLRTLLTLTVPADTVAKKDQAMVVKKSRAMVAEKNQAMAVRSLPAMAMSLLVGTAVPMALSTVASALRDHMELPACLESSVEMRMNMARGDKSMAQAGLVVNMGAPANMRMIVMEGDTKYDVPQVGCLMLMCCAWSTMMTLL